MGARLQAEIRHLAAQTGGPVFEPHLTLALGPLPDDLAWPALSSQLAGALQSIRLQAGPSAHTANYFQALYIRFGHRPEAVAALARLRQQLAAVLADVLSRHAVSGGQRDGCHGPVAGTGTSTDELGAGLWSPVSAAVPACVAAPAFEPHLSLCYGRLPPGERSALAARSLLQGQWLDFDTLVGVRPRPGASGLEQVADWDCFVRIKLPNVSG